MKELFKHLFWIAPAIAIILVFAVQDKEQIKADQAVDKAERRVEAAQFDKDFAQGWNKKAIDTPNSNDLSSAREELNAARKSRADADRNAADNLRDLKAAGQELSAEMGKH